MACTGATTGAMGTLLGAMGAVGATGVVGASGVVGATGVVGAVVGDTLGFGDGIAGALQRLTLPAPSSRSSPLGFLPHRTALSATSEELRTCK